MERFIKMLYAFTREEYADMVYVYGQCKCSCGRVLEKISVAQNTKPGCFYQRVSCIL